MTFKSLNEFINWDLFKFILYWLLWLFKQENIFKNIKIDHELTCRYFYSLCIICLFLHYLRTNYASAFVFTHLLLWVARVIYTLPKDMFRIDFFLDRYPLYVYPRQVFGYPYIYIEIYPCYIKKTFFIQKIVLFCFLVVWLIPYFLLVCLFQIRTVIIYIMILNVFITFKLMYFQFKLHV